MAPSPPATGLAPDLAAVLEQFEEAWQQPSPPSLDEFVRSAVPSANPARTALLVELVKIDLDHRWRGGGRRGPQLEEYAARFPELGPPATLPLDLIRAEYWVRHTWGDCPGMDDYRLRFPSQADGLQASLASLDTELPPGPARTPLALPVALPAAPVESGRTFLELLRALPLLREEQWAEVLRAEQHSSFPSPRELARFLLQRGWLTAFQVNQLFTGHGGELLLENYLVLERLGEGATGRVFKARHRNMDRLAAVKVIRPELLVRPEVVERFYQEVQAAGRLSHPNVVLAYDAGPTGRTHFFAMEYVEGTDLERLVAQEAALDAARASAYVRQAACGFAHAHDRGLVHRDVKPANLLLSGQGTIKVLDLGLARVHQALTESRWGQGLTADGAILGTPDYLAPEQADDPHHVDHRADIYSLGCTFYYLLSGRVPFPDCTLIQKLLRIQQAEPAALEELVPELPPGVGAIVRRMMAKRPADRYPTMAAVVRDLSDNGTAVAIAPLPVAAAAAPVAAPTPWAEPAASVADVSVGRPRRTPRRLRPALLLVTVVVAAGVVLVGLLGHWFRTGDNSRAGVVVSSARRAAPTAAEFKPLLDVPVARGLVGEVSRTELAAPLFSLAVAPDGRRAVVGGEGFVSVLDLKNWKVLRKMGQGELGHIRALALAPDGQRVLAGGDGCRVWVWEPRNEVPLEFTPRPSAVVWGVAFAPGGRQIAACTADGSVRCWDLAHPDEPKTLQAPDGQRNQRALAFCDQGRGIISVGNSQGEAVIRRWDLAAGRPNDYPPGKGWYWSLALSADSRLLLVGGLDGAPRLLDLKEGKERRLVAEDAPTLFAVAISPGGGHALTGGEGGELRLWDLADGKLIHRFTGHTQQVNAAAFSPDGRFALSCSTDKTVRLWSLPEAVWSPRAGATQPAKVHTSAPK